jgi:hypothetical protein
MEANPDKITMDQYNEKR